MKPCGNKIHGARTIVFVPNTYCNLGCSYCYLGSHTDKNVDTNSDITSNLKDIVNNFLEQGIVIEQFMLHGAETTTIPRKYLEEMFDYIKEYHQEYTTELKIFGNKKSPIHIKTNLFNYHTLINLFTEHKVSVSGSVDLPLSLHEKYRTTKQKKSTLDRTLKNVKLLKDYPYARQISCVVTKEHLEKFDEFVKDLKYLHEDVGFDMINNFYVMFAYDSVSAKDKFKEDFEKGASMLNQNEMLEFYNKTKEAFADTKYMKGVLYNWFKEFLPPFCTTALNCASTQLLIQKNGDAYPCHRTQPDSSFKFGNVFKDGIEKILDNGIKVIEDIENEMKMDIACTVCEYFKYCYLGCPLTRKDAKLDKSYTCKLQKEIYKDNPLRFPIPNEIENRRAIDDFIRANNVQVYENDVNLEIPRMMNYSSELEAEENTLTSIIKKDSKLLKIYKDSAFKIQLDEHIFSLGSPLLAVYQNVMRITPKTVVQLHISKEYLAINCNKEDLASNHLMMMMLRDTLVTYGDENRTKQEHIFDETKYYNSLLQDASETVDSYVLNISDVINRNKRFYKDGIINNLFFTTKNARNYHYEKHHKNAFYHIQSINLPFHNLLFLYKDKKWEI
jgi:uncharacterized protein